MLTELAPSGRVLSGAQATNLPYPGGNGDEVGQAPGGSFTVLSMKMPNATTPMNDGGAASSLGPAPRRASAISGRCALPSAILGQEPLWSGRGTHQPN